MQVSTGKLLLLAGCVMLSGCVSRPNIAKMSSQPQQVTVLKPNGHYKVGKPYSVKGQEYTPQETFSYDESGKASWYGPGFHGRKTANGEQFDKYDLTAAHRTLQMPSLVRVTNLKNGRAVVVRVNDRGPFSKGRIIDVSKRAAELLGMIQDGVADVRVQLLEPESRALAEAAKRGEQTVWLNSYRGLAEQGARMDKQVMAEAARRPVEPMIQPEETAMVSGPMPKRKPAGFAIIARAEAAPVAVEPAVTPSYIEVADLQTATQARDVAQKYGAQIDSRIETAQMGNIALHKVTLGPIRDRSVAQRLLDQLHDDGKKEARLVLR